MGVGHTFKRTPVGVYFGKKSVPAADPYFDGEGPDRLGCELCGECMTGCRRDAKNSLDKNYLYFSKQGAVWRVPRKQPGVPKGKPEKIADAGIEMDYTFIYFLDKDGDVARSKRAVGE